MLLSKTYIKTRKRKQDPGRGRAERHWGRRGTSGMKADSSVAELWDWRSIYCSPGECVSSVRDWCLSFPWWEEKELECRVPRLTKCPISSPTLIYSLATTVICATKLLLERTPTAYGLPLQLLYHNMYTYNLYIYRYGWGCLSWSEDMFLLKERWADAAEQVCSVV